MRRPVICFYFSSPSSCFFLRTFSPSSFSSPLSLHCFRLCRRGVSRARQTSSPLLRHCQPPLVLAFSPLPSIARGDRVPLGRPIVALLQPHYSTLCQPLSKLGPLSPFLTIFSIPPFLERFPLLLAIFDQVSCFIVSSLSRSCRPRKKKPDERNEGSIHSVHSLESESQLARHITG